MTTLVRHDLSDPATPEGMVRIVLGGSYRFIWPVHLGGWQSLGWQLQAAAGLPAPEPRLPELELDLELDPNLPSDPDPDPDPAPDPELDMAVLDVQTSPAVDESDPSSELDPAFEPQVGPDAETAEVLPVEKASDFQAMTKAQITEYCSSVYGVELDGSQTKAELVEQATSLELQAVTAIDGPHPDALLDDPLI
ncbi:hypothetical protein [Synechococcus sp. CBW1108]|uniref:hypothetical protein n=1 Tax=Synechococcus sp. CBW1108 TaxID=1353147 RepID=UPI0018CEFE71|nr:hypothetical protein [Synechococcus sp. CBW1108]QPN69917.1 hypothetical protein H8F27_16020 [Synechococcus sp. CBW1108]